MQEIRVNMFGEFVISSGDETVSDSDNRSKKLWFLLAYLIYNRDRIVKQTELVDALWSESDKGENPVGALKTMFHRARGLLDKLWDGAGKDLVISRRNGYAWNSDYPLVLDCDIFDDYCKMSKNELSLDDAVAMLHIYKGEFLERLSSEFWVMSIAAYYHNTFVDTLLRIFPQLIECERYREAVEFCRMASSIEPFHEEIHCCLMRAYILMGEQKHAVEVYQKLSDRLLSELGLIPSEETRAIYHEAIKSSNDHSLTVDALREQLTEADSFPGALVCEYDFFRVLHYSMARSVLRSGIAVHMLLITVKGRRGETLEAKKRDKIMDNLEDVIRYSLRRGDSAARCSANQFVVMLPGANYENSCMVSERILRAYYSKYTRLYSELRYEVFPIQPDDKENFSWMREPQEK